VWHRFLGRYSDAVLLHDFTLSFTTHINCRAALRPGASPDRPPYSLYSDHPRSIVPNIDRLEQVATFTVADTEIQYDAGAIQVVSMRGFANELAVSIGSIAAAG